MPNLLEKAVKSIQLEKKDGDLTWESERGWQILTGNADHSHYQTFQQFVEQGFRKNPVVASCVREIASSLSEAPIRAFTKEGDGSFTRIANHEADDFMDHPNDRDSWVSFCEKSAQHFFLGGNTVWKKKRLGSGKIEKVVPIRPDKIVGATVTGDEELPIAYHIQPDPNDSHIDIIDANDIVHIPDIDPLNDVFGMPRLMAAALETASDNEASAYVSEILRNHGTPGVVVSLDRQKVNEQILNQAEDRWQDKFGPGRGRGKVAFVPGATHIKDIGFNLRDLEFPSLRMITREGICTVMGVDPILISLGSASRGGTMSGAEHSEARRKLWEQTIIPLIRRWESVINAFLAPEFGSGVWLKFDLSDVVALREARSETIDRMTKLANAGSFTLEEIREEGGFNATPNAGSMIVVPQNFQFVRAGGEEGGDILNSPKQETTPPPVVDDDKSLSKKNRPSKGSTFSVLGFQLHGGNFKQDGFAQFDSFAESESFVYEQAALSLFDRERRRVINTFQRHLRHSREESSNDAGLDTKQVDPDSIQEALDELEAYFEEQKELWDRDFRNVSEQTADRVSASMVAGFGFTTTEVAAEIALVLDERANLMRDVPGRTFAALKNTVAEGIAEGDDMNGITNRVRDVFDSGRGWTDANGNRHTIDADSKRARKIARTESGAITNGAAVATVNASDLADSTVKVWISQGDERVRPHHIEEEAASADGIPVKDEFPVTGLQYPSEPNCRCSVAFRIVE